MAVTSRVRTTPAFGEFEVVEWKRAGLILPSVAKPVLATIEKRLVMKIERLSKRDKHALLKDIDMFLKGAGVS